MLYALYPILPDRASIQIYYFSHFKRFANLRNPKTYNEKLNWLKLHDRNLLYSRMVDKYEAKEYVAEIIGNEYIVPTLGVWEHFDDIDFEEDIVMVNGEYDWMSIEKRLIEMTKIQDKTFEAFPFSKKNIKNR